MRTKNEDGVTMGFRCSRCGTFHKFPKYVFMNWKKEVFYTCPQCYAYYSIIEGVVFLEDHEER